MSLEAMKQALESMQRIDAWLIERGYTGLMPQEKEVIINLEKAIAELESQEPVAWSYWQSCLNDDGTQTAPWVHRLSKFKPHESIINKDVVPLYTHPPQRKCENCGEFGTCCLKTESQEPVAYLNPDDLCADTAFRWCKIDAFTKPVYTHPPQRTWTDLTDEQLADCIPDGFEIIEKEDERKRVALTRQQLHEFLRNVARIAGPPQCTEPDIPKDILSAMSKDGFKLRKTQNGHVFEKVEQGWL